MRSFWASLGVVAVVMAHASAALILGPQPAPTDPVLGTYRCTGTGDDGAAYELTLTVTAHQDAYRLVWTDQGTPAFAGFGVRVSDVLAVIFSGPHGVASVAAYRMAPGELVGDWTDGDGAVRTETCRRGQPA